MGHSVEMLSTTYAHRMPAGDGRAAIVMLDSDGVSGAELCGTGWRPECILVAGDRPSELAGDIRHCAADWSGIDRISRTKPEFFVYAGHGSYNPEFDELGPYLQLGRRWMLTQYDVALRLRLPRNKLSVVGACLAGQGASTAGGDVVGFLRAFIAAGAGAIAMPLWSVLDDAIVDSTRALLAASRNVLGSGGVFDAVAALHAHYKSVAASGYEDSMRIEHMPLTLYL